MNYTNGQTELNLYCQSKIIRLENQNTKPNLAFNERFFLSYRSPGFPTLSFVPLLFLTLFLVPALCAAHQLYLHFWPIFFVLFKTILFACSVVWWLCVCRFFLQRNPFSDQFPYICIYLPHRLFLLLSVRIAHASLPFNWIRKSIFRYCSFMTYTHKYKCYSSLAMPHRTRNSIEEYIPCTSKESARCDE